MSGQDPYETTQPPEGVRPTQPVPGTAAEEPTGAAQPASAGGTPEPTGGEETTTQNPAGGYPGGAYPGGAYPTGGYPGGAPPGGAYPPGGATWGGAPPSTGYAPSGYPYPAPQQRTDDKAVWALVSSIAGFILCPIVLHVVGWVLANQSLRAIRESRGALSGDGVAKTAKVLGIVGVVLYSIGLVVAILFFAIAVPLGILAASTSSEGSLDIGNETVVPTSLAAVDGESFTHSAGEITYDLTGLDFAGRAADMSVVLGAGTLTIEVPDDVTVNLDAQVGAGELDAFGERTDGVGVSRQGTYEGTAEEGGVLDLEVNVTVGELEITRG
jgi:hypothetical protein